jgi:hypothetical protein
VVASDYLVSYETNRYSVPFTLIGQTVELERQGKTRLVWYREQVVARHALQAERCHSPSDLPYLVVM